MADTDSRIAQLEAQLSAVTQQLEFEKSAKTSTLGKPSRVSTKKFLLPSTFVQDCVHAGLHPVDAVGRLGEPYLLALDSEPSYQNALVNKKSGQAGTYRHTQSAKVYNELVNLALEDLVAGLVQVHATADALLGKFKEMCPEPARPTTSTPASKR